MPELPIKSFEIFASGLDHPECLAFSRDGNLWAGGEAGQVYRIDLAGKAKLVTQLNGFCAGLAFSPEEELYVCNANLGVVRVRSSGRSAVVFNEVEGRKIICANFGVFDSRGNYYVTESGNWKKQNGFLLRTRLGASPEIMGGPFGYVNGLALSADERILWMVESDSNRVYQLPLGQDGNLEGPPIVYCEVGRFPDGLALDAAGHLYVSCYASDEIWRVSPAREISLFAFDPEAILLNRPTNMAFGGPNLEFIYVSNLGRTTITRAKSPRAGQPLVNLRAALGT